MKQQLSSADIVKILNTSIVKMKYPDISQFVEKIKFLLRTFDHAPDTQLQKLNLFHNKDFYRTNLNRKLTEAALRKNELWRSENLVEGEQTLFGLGEILDMSNYNEYIHKIKVSSLPQALKDGHSFFLKHRHDFDSNDAIKETIIDYLTDLNVYVSKLPKKTQDIIFADTKGYSGRKFTGTNYKHVKGMPIAEIAKLIKEELKVTFGDDASFSVRTETFSGGRSLTVTVTDLNFDPYSEEYAKHLLANDDWNSYRRHGSDPPKYNSRAEKFLDKVKKIINQYNYDDSDSMTDYFSVSFYDHHGIDDKLLIKKYYPDNIENNKTLAWWEETNRKSKEANEKARERRGKFAKYQPILYEIRNWRNVPDGDYKGIVTKSPSGQGRGFSYYTISVAIDKKKNADGSIKELPLPVIQTVDNVTEKSIRADDALTESAQREFKVGDQLWYLQKRDRNDYYGALELKAGLYPVKISKRIKGQFPVYFFEIPIQKWNEHKNEYFPSTVNFYSVGAHKLMTDKQKQEYEIAIAEAEALALELELLNFKNHGK